MDDLIKIFVTDAAEGGEESAPGLAGLHGAIFRFWLIGVFGYGLDGEFTEPDLESKGGQVKVVVGLFGEGDSFLGVIDEWKVHKVE